MPGMDASRPPLRGISSMATRHLLVDLAGVCVAAGGTTLALESVGGVDAARRVQEGEGFDLVFLASDAVAKLVGSAYAVAGSAVDLVRSQVAVAVKTGTTPPDLRTEDSVRTAVLDAASVGYSTGPSGTALLALFERWGITEQLRPKLVQARAGTPVATLVARGEVALGFQQRSEMLGAEGIEVVGDLPPAIAIETIFSGAICATSQRVDESRALLERFAAADCADIKRRHGMSPL